MKLTRKMTFVLLFLFAISSCIAGSKDIEANGWTIKYDEASKTFSYAYKGKMILSYVYARAKVGSDTLQSNQYETMSIQNKKISDKLGKGIQYTVLYQDHQDTKVNLRQEYYFYENQEHFLTELFVDSKDEISSNYLAPIYSTSQNSFLESSDKNRVLRVPYDNDAFIHYDAHTMDVEDVSFEVTTFFAGDTREGLVIGSVEHDTWKTGIVYKAESTNKITKLECYGGITHKQTRDISDREDRPSCHHGSIKGKSLKSPKVLVGFFADWRRGLEMYGEVNAMIAPPRKWNKPTPFGWNSWAALADKVNFEAAIDVADFIKNELQPKTFENEGVTYIGLDSFWDNFTEDQLREFVKHCNAQGQQAGIYWCPFSDWHGNAEVDVEGTNGEYKYKDIYLYANGKPRKVESLAIDPTHPATKLRIDHYINKFKDWGYTYVKFDFMNNGALEAESFYDPAVTTGTQAYNEGMSYLTQVCGEDMFIALSIAPIFPAQYGTSRRISCDTWGAMGQGAHGSTSEGGWGSTGYMLNSLSFGWWLDRVYPYNDSDHILLHKPSEAHNYGEGSNRARVTSAVITGIYMLGDNFSLKGSFKGDKEARERALKAVTNADINDIARIGKSFYPVEGYEGATSDKSANFFMYHTDKYLYVAVFNFDDKNVMNGSLDYARLDINTEEVNEIKELWMQETIENVKAVLEYSVPSQDVRVYRVEKK